MKLIIAAIALALVAPGIYDLSKRVQSRCNADAQALYDAQQTKASEEKKRAAEKAAEKVAAAEEARKALPRLHFTGKISQHSGDGLLVDCPSWRPYRNKGHKAEAVTGSFFLLGHPGLKTLPDDTEIEFYAQHDGLVEYTTLLGYKRTIAKLIYAGPSEP